MGHSFKVSTKTTYLLELAKKEKEELVVCIVVHNNNLKHQKNYNKISHLVNKIGHGGLFPYVR